MSKTGLNLGPLVLDENEGAYVPVAMKARTHVKTSRVRAFRERRNLTYPVKNGYGDPLSNALMLDVIARLRTGQVLRASTLTALLNAECPQVAWDAYTVGRMLSNLAASAAQAPLAVPPIEAASDWAGRYFTIDPTPEAHAWLIETLDTVGKLAATEVQNIRAGIGPESRLVDPIALAQAQAAA